MRSITPPRIRLRPKIGRKALAPCSAAKTSEVATTPPRSPRFWHEQRLQEAAEEELLEERQDQHGQRARATRSSPRGARACRPRDLLRLGTRRRAGVEQPGPARASARSSPGSISDVGARRRPRSARAQAARGGSRARARPSGSQAQRDAIRSGGAPSRTTSAMRDQAARRPTVAPERDQGAADERAAEHARTTPATTRATWREAPAREVHVPLGERCARTSVRARAAASASAAATSTRPCSAMRDLEAVPRHGGYAPATLGSTRPLRPLGERAGVDQARLRRGRVGVQPARDAAREERVAAGGARVAHRRRHAQRLARRAMPVLSSTPAAPSSIAMATSEAVPTPASTITGHAARARA